MLSVMQRPGSEMMDVDFDVEPAPQQQRYLCASYSAGLGCRSATFSPALPQLPSVPSEEVSSAEWMMLQAEDRSKCHVAEASMRNRCKNRYSEHFTLDATRVCLGSICPCHPHRDGSYISANYISDMKGNNKRYIATQAPKPCTMADFWHMVWQEKSSIIVMVTNLLERNRIKAHVYWPELEETQSFERISVTCVSQSSVSSMGTRTFSLLDLQHPELGNRIVTQVYFAGWPDCGVPSSVDNFNIFLKTVSALEREANSKAPMIVHCSAGIGRTGTFCACHSFSEAIESGMSEFISLSSGHGYSLYDHVRNMRTERRMMVQSFEQYKFCVKFIFNCELEYRSRMALHAQFGGHKEMANSWSSM